MQDERFDNLLCDWSNANLPEDETRAKILRGVLVRSQPAVPDFYRRPPLLRRPLLRSPFLRRRIAAALSGIAVVAATLLLMVSLPPEQPINIEIPVVQNDPVVQDDDQKVRISLIVLKQLPDSEAAVEFLEDAIFVAEKQQLHELELGGHRLFLWIYPLEERLFSVDIGMDNAAGTGIVAVPDRPQVLQFQSDGDNFNVFVSVLPWT